MTGEPPVASAGELRLLLRRLHGFLEPGARRRLGVLVLVTAAGSVLEAVGIGLVLPYLRAVTRPGELLAELAADPRAGPVLEAAGITGPAELVVWSSAALVLLFVVKNAYLGHQWRSVFGFLYAESSRLARRLLDGYLAAPYPFHLERNTAGLVRNTTTEPRRVFGGAVAAVLILTAELLVIAGLVAVLFLTHTAAAAGVLTLLALLGWGLTAAFRKRLQRMGRLRAEHQSRMIRAVNESLGGIKEVKLLHREDYFSRAFGRSVEPFTESLREERVIRQYPRLMLETGAVVVMIGLAGVLVLTGEVLVDAIPVVGLFGIAIIRLMPSVNRVVDNFNQLRYEAPAIEIVHEELERIRGWAAAAAAAAAAGGTTEAPGAPAAARALEAAAAGVDAGGEAAPGGLPFRERVEVRDLTYRYPESSGSAVDGVDVTVERGEWVGIVGASGAGKTTLVNLFLGLLEPDAGAIFVDGRDVRQDLAAWQRLLGYIPQDTFLLDDTLRRNVAFGVPDGEIDEVRVRGALAGADLEAWVEELDAGLETVVGERGVRVSGGQRQRVAIARALYHGPEILVLDEATSSLDYETEARIIDAIGELAGEKTLLMVTHRIETVRRCDVIHVLEEGRLADSGGYQRLAAESAAFRRLAREGARAAVGAGSARGESAGAGSARGGSAGTGSGGAGSAGTG